MSEKPNYDLDLKPEIKAILENKRVVNSEVDFLRIALDRNKGNEKELLHKTGKKDLLIISNALGTVPYGKHVKKRIDRILSGKTEENFLEKIAIFFSNKSKSKENTTTNKNLVDKNERQKTKTLYTIKAEIKQSGVNIRKLQKRIGAKPDGDFGPNSFRKYKAKNKDWGKENISDFMNKKIKTTEEKNFFEKMFDGNEKKDSMKNLDKEYPSINNIEGLKDLLKSKSITIKDITGWLNKGYKTIKIKYRSGFTDKNGNKVDKVNISELKKFHDEVMNASNYVKESVKNGIKKSANGQINNKEMSLFARLFLTKNKEKPTITTVIATAQKYYHGKEKGTDELSKELRKNILKFGLDINNPRDYWCAAFVGMSLVEGKTFNSISELRKKVRNVNRAAAYLGGNDFPGHIGINIGGGIMINGNVKGAVHNSYINKKKIVGWVMPKDVGNKDAVIKLGKPYSNVSITKAQIDDIPVGAVIVFWRGKANKKWA